MIELQQVSHRNSDRRTRRDRLEVLTALIDAPNFDQLYRDDIIRFPARHPTYWWGCEVTKCEAIAQNSGFCRGHDKDWREGARGKIPRSDFARQSEPIEITLGSELVDCRICGGSRQAVARTHRLCNRHRSMWFREDRPDVERWSSQQAAFRSFGPCLVTTCPELAQSPLGLCTAHVSRYEQDDSPGNASLPLDWFRTLEPKGEPVPRLVDDQVAFRRWCSSAFATRRAGMINLLGIKPLVSAEIKWALFRHAQLRHAPRWVLSAIQHLVELCRTNDVVSLFDLAPVAGGAPELPGHSSTYVRMILREIADGLRPVYYSPLDARDAGFLETSHYGWRHENTRSCFDLTAVTQRWLRDILWEHWDEVLQSPRAPRSRGPLDGSRRAVIALSAFLEIDAPAGGHDPTLLAAEHAQRYVADQRHRAQHQLPSLGLHRKDRQPSVLSDTSCRLGFNHLRAVIYRAFERGTTNEIGLSRDFVTVLPFGGTDPKRSRSPFPDEMARALADEDNLRRLEEVHDPKDRGIRDIWETIVLTGRRVGEVLGLRIDCIGRYNALPLLWHDQTKVGRYDEAVRIPERLHQRLDARRSKTLQVFHDRHGRTPSVQERARIMLFPSHIRNPRLELSLSTTRFNSAFRGWVESLEIGPAVPHQARHTMATNLLRAGATLTHIRRYLGHVSDRMAEHYAHVSNSDLEDVLQTVWVSGPGSKEPGTLLSSAEAPLTRHEAMALALDLTRRSTPTEGGFCTFQPVVSGNTCPWKLNCENCDHFVLSGADLLYWRRKQEQWRSIAERAPDDTTADYLHQVFEPTALAIAGLERALAGIGLLDQALTVDLRRPQDYFERLWSTGFRVDDLVKSSAADAEPKGTL